MRLYFCLPAALALAACASCSATILDISDGSTVIGTLNSAVTPDGIESAIFTLLPQYRGLMSDAQGLQFRWFDTIYYDDEPTGYLSPTDIITPASTPAHTGTVVDPPAGGWYYQRFGGDDYSPFYESDTSNNPLTGRPYYFPTLSYPYEHSPDGVNPGTSSTIDAPGLADPNHQTLFETYLAFIDPALGATNTFDVLGGFSWGVQTDSQDTLTGIQPVNIPFSAIDSSKVNELQGAINRSGFTGQYAWTVQALDAFAPLAAVPEPGSGAFVIIGLLTGCLGVVARGRGRACSRL